MKLATFEQAGEETLGALIGNNLINLTEALWAYQSQTRQKQTYLVMQMVDFFNLGFGELSELQTFLNFLQEKNLLEQFIVRRPYTLKAPIPRPLKIIALGRNYALHAAESKSPVPDEPIIFLKSGSSVIGPNETVEIPKEVGRVDHEVELAVVIGKKAKRVSKEHAFEYIIGYTIALDVTARDLQRADIEKRQPWYRSKSFDTFTPLGPWIVTADEIPSPVHLNIELSVNGQIRQKSNTKEMVFDIPTTIEFITKYITLEPGDIISMGTPEGISPLQSGDKIISRIEKIGELVNFVKEV